MKRKHKSKKRFGVIYSDDGVKRWALVRAWDRKRASEQFVYDMMSMHGRNVVVLGVEAEPCEISL